MGLKGYSAVNLGPGPYEPIKLDGLKCLYGS